MTTWPDVADDDECEDYDCPREHWRTGIVTRRHVSANDIR